MQAKPSSKLFFNDILDPVATEDNGFVKLPTPQKAPICQAQYIWITYYEVLQGGMQQLFNRRLVIQ